MLFTFPKVSVLLHAKKNVLSPKNNFREMGKSVKQFGLSQPISTLKSEKNIFEREALRIGSGQSWCLGWYY